MSTSGTTGQTTIEVVTLIEHIARRCKVMPNKLTPETVQTIKNVMFMFLATLANRGINMWRVQRGLFGLTPGQATYVLASGTLDVLHAHLRTPTRLAGDVVSSAGGTVANLTDGDASTIFTQTSAGGDVQWDFTDDHRVNLVGLLPGASSTLDLVFETSENGSDWDAARDPASIAFTDERWKWYNIEPAKKRRYFRVRETSTGTISMRDIFVCESWSEVDMYRMNRDEYASLPSKRSEGEPRQFWLDRQLTPQMIMWPTPNDGSSRRLVSLVTHMQIEDVGDISNTLAIPQRWYDAVVANCAFMSILDIPEADVARYEMLKDQASITMQAAEAEERDASPTNWVPNISPYTQ